MGKWTSGLSFAIDAKKCLDELAQLDRIAADVEAYTVKDVRRWLPGHVSSAVSKVYRIRKSEVAACQTRKDGEYHRGRNAGKATVRTSFSGYTLAGFSVTFKGRVLSTWMTKAKPKPKKAKGKAYSAKRKYRVTQEVFRGKAATINPSAGNRVFVLDIGGKMRPIVAHEEKLHVHASSSVPQAILNKKTVAIWRPQLNTYLERRFNHHANRLWFSKR